MALKLAIGVKISSALRTISHFTANFGPRFSIEVIPHISIDHSVLFIAQETASAVHKSADPEVAKHLTAVLREEFQPKGGEALILYDVQLFPRWITPELVLVYQLCYISLTWAHRRNALLFLIGSTYLVS